MSLLPIYLLAAAAAVLLAGDTSRDPTPPPALPLPPASPPSSPLPDARTLPRGINPALFRRSARQVSQELQSLFQRAYVLDHEARELRAQNPAAVGRLRSRIDQLREIAFHDPWAAREYDRPEIRRYFYFQNMDPLGAYYHLVNFDHPAPFLTRVLYGSALMDFEFARDFDGTGSIVEHLPWNIEAIMRSYPRDLWHPLLTHAVNASLYEEPLIEDEAVRSQLFQANSRDLVELWQFLFDLGVERDSLEWANLPSEIPVLLRRLIPALRESDVSEAEMLPRMLIFIPYLAAARGLLPEDFMTRYFSARNPAGDGLIRRYANGYLASQTLDPFDDISHRHQLREGLENYLLRYLSLSPAQRAQEDPRLNGQGWLRLFESEDASLDLGREEAERIRQRVSRRTGRSFSPSPRDVPLTPAQLLQEAARPEGVELTPQDLPPGWRSFAQSFPLPFHGEETSLWDFLSENVSSIIFAAVSEAESEEFITGGAINTLTRTVIIDPELSQRTQFEVLFHEAYHLYFHHVVAARAPALREAVLINERNAYLFETQINQVLLENSLSRTPLDEARIADEVSAYCDSLLMGLAANAVLGYPEEDASLRYDLTGSASVTDLHRHPSALLQDYARRRGAPDYQTLLQREISRRMSEIIGGRRVP